MKTIANSSPFVPAELIAAHGMRPQWLRLRAASGGASLAVTRGICPYAGSLIDAALSGIDADALVLTTVCDQMRYAAAMIESRGSCPVFLLNVPSTWQTAEVKRLYLDELRRLGRFLVGLGGKTPDDADLAKMMLEYDRARSAICSARDRMSARQFADALAELRGPALAELRPSNKTLTPGPSPKGRGEDLSESLNSINGVSDRDGIPLAVLGGPLLESDIDFYNIVEQCGGRVVLDGTEGGERTLPRPFDPARIASDPMQELADTYFNSIPDAFRRPNDRLYEWLGHELAERQVRGIIFRRYIWCDLWHGELHRLKQWSPAPVLDIDACADDVSAENRVQGRIESFLEMLR